MKGKQELVLLLMCLCCVYATSEPPCGYYQSVNITGAVINDNESAIFEGTEYPYGSYGLFKDSFFGAVDQDETHLRGCFCHLPGKPCLEFCCPVGFIKRRHYDSPCYPYNFDLQIKSSNDENNFETIKVAEKYRIVQSDPCPQYVTHLSNMMWELSEVFKIIILIR